jgi:hypothetical protein
MSHLRPVHKDSGKPKTYAEYTDEERASAFMQVTDAERVRANQPSAGPIPKKTAELLVALSKGQNGKPLPHADQLPQYVIEAAAAKQ